MTRATSQLIDDFRRLSAAERAEFLDEALAPRTTVKDGDLTDDDVSMISARTFARLDAEEERDAKN